MRIYSMTATFGKLEHETLTLEPGLNVLHKPNEWGKSTWCAFLIAMLYGLDTRAKSTKGSLADKERYAPWSGAPMAGRIDLNWDGRDITIERSTKGRIPLGQFRAYETASGLAVPELDGMNCGQRLLGVERSVFARAGFIRFSDLPVTQDEALRRRLNALVTTGDESGDGDTLASALRELKNRCRYNRSGLLPQARQQLEALLRKLDELTALEEQAKKLRVRQGEVSAWQNSLSNHAQALRYAGAEADAAKVAEAREEFDRAVKRTEVLERACASLPSREETRQMLLKTKQLAESWSAAQLEESLLPPPPAPAEAPPPFRELNPDGAEAKAREDADRYARLAKPTWLAFLLAAMAAILTGGVLLALGKTLFGISAGVPGLGLLLFALSQKRRRTKERAAIAGRYPTAGAVASIGGRLPGRYPGGRRRFGTIPGKPGGAGPAAGESEPAAGGFMRRTDTGKGSGKLESGSRLLGQLRHRPPGDPSPGKALENPAVHGLPGGPARFPGHAGIHPGGNAVPAAGCPGGPAAVRHGRAEHRGSSGGPGQRSGHL